jgi:hypothetical protein
MKVRIFADLLNGHTSAELRCLYTGSLVRKFVLSDSGDIFLDPTEGPGLYVPASTPVYYEPWVMDRGSILFRHKQYGDTLLKLCGKGDPIRFEDGTEDLVEPDPACPKAPHTALYSIV